MVASEFTVVTGLTIRPDAHDLKRPIGTYVTKPWTIYPYN